MKDLNKNRIKISMKRRTLDKIIDTFLGGEDTRKDISSACNVSLTSVSRVSDAMLSTGLIKESFYSSNGERPITHLSLSESIKILVLDISSYVYTAYVTDHNYSCCFRYNYTYDPSSAFDDNLLTFISRCKLKYAESSRTVYAVCVLLPDENFSQRSLSPYPCAYIPSERDKDLIGSYVSVIWRHSDINYIKVSDAISSAMKYSSVKNAGCFGGTSYIFLGTKLSALHISQDGNATVCHAEGLIIDEGKTLTDMMSGGLTRRDFDTVIIRAANLLDCAFTTETLIIESDMYVFDDSDLHTLAKSFARIGRLTPFIVSRKSDPPLRVEGAARATVAHLIKCSLIASDE